MIAKQLVTDTIIPLKRSDTGDFAISQMEELRCSHLPIVDGVDFWGVISDTEILAQQEPDQEVGRYKQSLLNAYISENQHIFEVIKVFSTVFIMSFSVV